MRSASKPAQYPLLIVTGAPGAGKSSVVEAMLALETPFVAFDIDWLIKPASALAGRDIHFEPDTWPSYGRLWWAVLYAIYRNGRTPVLFAPFDRADITPERLPDWCSRVEMLLLDCEDDVRLTRLRRRSGWSESHIREAMHDAAVLRKQIQYRLDTGERNPTRIARRVVQWLEDLIPPGLSC